MRNFLQMASRKAPLQPLLIHASLGNASKPQQASWPTGREYLADGNWCTSVTSETLVVFVSNEEDRGQGQYGSRIICQPLVVNNVAGVVYGIVKKAKRQ